MRFVQKWSYSCASHFTLAMKENHKKRAIYYYGFYILFGSLVKGFIIITAALLLGALIPTLIIVFIFGLLRMFAGGLHMITYEKCLFASLFLFLISGTISQYTYQYWNFAAILVLIILTFIFGIYIINKYAPIDTPNKPITNPKDIKKFKKLSIIFICIWFVLCIVFAVFNLKLIIMAMSFGVLLELFTLTPTGYIFLDTIIKIFDKRNIYDKTIK